MQYNNTEYTKHYARSQTHTRPCRCRVYYAYINVNDLPVIINRINPSQYFSAYAYNTYFDMLCCPKSDIKYENKSETKEIAETHIRITPTHWGQGQRRHEYVVCCAHISARNTMNRGKEGTSSALLDCGPWYALLELYKTYKPCSSMLSLAAIPCVR